MSSLRLLVVLVACSASLVAPPRASACGGFFCQTVPVVQTAEEILYVTDSDGALSMSVRINYSGAAPEFAWILPVPTAPTLSLGTVDVFDALRAATEPTFIMSQTTEGTCATDPRCEFPDVRWFDVAASDAAALSDAPGPGVLIRGELGPFETVVIGDASATEIHMWLTTNGYDLAAESIPILDEYVRQSYLFVALRLRTDATVDAIQPVTLRWDTPTPPCLPIRLTRIATAAQLPIVAYFLGQTRATPRNYSLIEDVDDLALYRERRPGWSTLVYRSWASAEIDGLGGHAFVVDYAGVTPTASLESASLEDLRTASAGDVVAALVARGYDTPAVNALLERFLVPPMGMDFINYRNCLRFGTDCGDPTSFDAPGFVDAVNATIIQPRAVAQGWLRTHPYTTRLYTELSAAEMTVDPEFVYDDGLGDFTNMHLATTVTECSPEYYWLGAPVRVDFASGRTQRVSEGMRITPAMFCERRGGWLAGTRPGSFETGAGGFDAGSGGMPGGGGGCHVGARTGTPLGVVPLALLALVAMRRRRR